MKISILKDLLKRYHNGTATRAEHFIVDTWYRSFDSHQQQIPGINTEEEANETEQKIFNKINLSLRVKPWYQLTAFQAACSVVIIFAATLSLYIFRHKADAPDLVFQTKNGQTEKISLPDRSSIWINSNTRLEISSHYGEVNRTVKLEGEAFFDVSHNPQRPFIVKTGNNITTHVLGTSFAVQAYKKSRFARVTLLTGKIWVKPALSAGNMLLPNQTLQYDCALKSATKTDVISGSSSRSWINGKISFDNTPMQEVAETLNRDFNLNIKIATAKLNNCRLYGEFKIDDRPEKVLKTICRLINANYYMHGSEIYIRINKN